ncbi:MAG: DUF1501 domain-containing protein [Verrucomicrobiota bacterium]
MNDQSYNLSRRSFLAKGSCGMMGIAPIINTLSQLQLVNSAAASTNGGGSVGTNYKALVCVFLRGGCDMNNVLIPIHLDASNTNTQAAGYAADRATIAINNGVNAPNETIPLTLPGNERFGLHPSLVNFANVFGDGDATFLTNVGTLAEPTNASNYNNVILPRQLYSHSDQTTEWMASVAEGPVTSGWGARAAELLNDTWNPNSEVSMLISAAGNAEILGGSPSVPQVSVTSTGAISLAGFSNNNSPYGQAINPQGNYRNNRPGRRLQALEEMMGYSREHILEEGYSTVVRRARENEALILEASSAAAGLGLDVDGIFSSFNANSNVADELKAVFRLIAGRECLGNTRQIFFVDYGSFDFHQDINLDMAGLLTDLDNALGAFNSALKQLASADVNFSHDMVTSFTGSDFNRTWTPNSDNPDTAGTDHAWGSHAIIMGGAVNGSQLYGTFPELALGGSSDIPGGARGRWIPTTSVDEFTAILANWFGVPPGSAEMTTILPNLDRFPNPFTTPDLAFL